MQKKKGEGAKPAHKVASKIIKGVLQAPAKTITAPPPQTNEIIELDSDDEVYIQAATPPETPPKKKRKFIITYEKEEEEEGKGEEEKGEEEEIDEGLYPPS